MAGKTKSNTTTALMYTVHGIKKPQGVLAIVNQKAALAYVERLGKQEQLVGYTFLDEFTQRACSCHLPIYQVDF